MMESKTTTTTVRVRPSDIVKALGEGVPLQKTRYVAGDEPEIQNTVLEFDETWDEFVEILKNSPEIRNRSELFDE